MTVSIYQPIKDSSRAPRRPTGRNYPTRVKAVCDAGHKPIRVMFYYPNREQAFRIQQALESIYKGVHGEHYYADAAWDYVKQRTGIDLHGILKELATERSGQRE
jgi:hypothetical protein